MKLALLGNCAYQALVDDRARIVWLCWPRFDSSFVFGSLLDEQRGGEMSVTPTGGDWEVEQGYLPETAILRTVFSRGDAAVEVVDFAPRFLQYERSFKPTMLVRRVRRLSGSPTVRVVCRPVHDYGRSECDSYLASNHIEYMVPGARMRLTTNAPLTYVREGRPFALEETIYLVMTWGEPLEASLAETCEGFYGRTRHYWETWVKHAAIPERFQHEVIRSAITLKLHQFEDTGAITAAATTSIPEYPGSGRTWDYRYCWLRDACFTLGALRRLGHFEEMERFASFLLNVAEDAGDQLQPVYAISGEGRIDEQVLDHLSGFRGDGPVRVGNAAYQQLQHDVYGEMLGAVAPLFRDVRFRDLQGKRSTALLHRLLASIDAHLESPDAGLWEKRESARLYTFTLLMHWTGAAAAAMVGKTVGDTTLVNRGDDLAARAATLIEGAWRPDLQMYADSPAGDQADGSLMMMVNLGYLPARSDRSIHHVRALARALSANGSHLLYRYRHHDGIGDTHAAFTVCAFWYAEALARQGFHQEAEEVFTHVLSHTNHVGLLSEDIDPKSGARLGNFPQTYSHVGIINTAFCLAPPSGPLI